MTVVKVTRQTEAYHSLYSNIKWMRWQEKNQKETVVLVLPKRDGDVIILARNFMGALICQKNPDQSASLVFVCVSNSNFYVQLSEIFFLYDFKIYILLMNVVLTQQLGTCPKYYK